MKDDRTFESDVLANKPVLNTILNENDPIVEIAKSLKSIDKTLKRIEEDMRKRRA